MFKWWNFRKNHEEFLEENYGETKITDRYGPKGMALHITDVCEGHCPMCYETEEGKPRKHGDLETLKLIITNAIKNGGLEEFTFVGGDPCTHPHLVELLKYVKEEGKKYHVNTKNIVLSNTHDYRENGKVVPIEKVAHLIDEVDVTVHAATAEEHDAFNGCKGSYEHVMGNLNKFAEVKKEGQTICAVVNIMPSTIKQLKEMTQATISKLDGKLDSFMIQRIALVGRAEGKEEYRIRPEQVNKVMDVFYQLKKNGTDVVFCDVFPWCALDPQYRSMLPKGGCNWGADGGMCAVFMDGTISRCAMSENSLSTNITALKTPKQWNHFWKKDAEIRAFVERKHLSKGCKKCKDLENCGGSCVMSRTAGDPYKGNPKHPTKDYDYLVPSDKTGKNPQPSKWDQLLHSCGGNCGGKCGGNCGGKCRHGSDGR